MKLLSKATDIISQNKISRAISGIIAPTIREILVSIIWIYALTLIGSSIPLYIIITLAIIKAPIPAIKNLVGFKKLSLNRTNKIKHKKLWEIFGMFCGTMLIIGFVGITIFTFETLTQTVQSYSYFSPTIINILSPTIIIATIIITLKDIVQINKGISITTEQNQDNTVEKGICNNKPFLKGLNYISKLLAFWDWERKYLVTLLTALTIAGIVTGSYFAVTTITNPELQALVILTSTIIITTTAYIGWLIAHKSCSNRKKTENHKAKKNNIVQLGKWTIAFLARILRGIVDIIPVVIIMSEHMPIAITTAIGSALFTTVIINSLVFFNLKPMKIFTSGKMRYLNIFAAITIIATIIVLNEWAATLGIMGTLKVANITDQLAIILIIIFTTTFSVISNIQPAIKICDSVMNTTAHQGPPKQTTKKRGHSRGGHTTHQQHST